MQVFRKKSNGLTLIELMVTLLISSILLLAVGVTMLDSHRGWLDSYDKVFGGAADDAAMSGTAFEQIVRKASLQKYQFNGTDDLTVYYYKDWLNSESLDAYGRFYRSPADPRILCFEKGGLDPVQIESTVQLATHVTDLHFRPLNGGLEMVLVLNDGRETTTRVTAAILHNE